MRSFLPTCALILVMVLPIQAQEFGRVGEIETEGSSYHVFARPGEATVRVLVLGPIMSPGLYEVGEKTDLSQLLALAGGTSLAPLSREEKREVTVRLFRQEAGRRTLLYEAPLDRMLAEPDQYPVLQDGDLFTIEVFITRRSRFTWETAFRIVTSTASLFFLIDRLVRYSK